MSEKYQYPYPPQQPPGYGNNNNNNNDVNDYYSNQPISQPNQPEYDYSQQQGYAPQNQQFSQPPVQDFNSKPGDGQTFEQQFKVDKPKINDPIFIVVFLAVLGGFCAVAGITLKSYSGSKSFQGGSIYDGNNGFSLNTNTMVLFAFIAVVAVVLSILYYVCARMFTRKFIIITMILNLIMAFGTAIFYLVEKYWSAGVVFLLFACVTAWCYWTMRHRIPFATLVLQTVIDVTRLHPSVLMISAIGSLVAGAFGVFFSMVLVATYVKYDPNDNNPNCSAGGCSQGKLVGLIIYITFASFYISEVIKNVIHTTICGVYGSWYYCSKSDQGMPKWPAMGAFKRSMTYSFGSISFGSLIVAFINLLRYILSSLRSANQQNGGNMMMNVVLMCAQCLVGILDWAVQYFNHYAYTYIALYGKAYLPAAKDTWQIIKSRGIDALVNDSLIGNVLKFGSLFVAYVTALLAYLYLKLTKPEYNSSGGFYPIVVAFAFVIGLQIGNITTVSIKSGVSTFFVALAKDPEVFKMSYPQIYENLVQTYPPLREKLNI